MKIKNISQERIFIAGGSGMVGSAIRRKLLKVNQFINSNNILTPTRNELNLFDFSSLDNWFKQNKPTVVIIAAAKVGGIYANQKNQFDFILENIKIQTNLIELSWKHKIKKLLFLGSSCIYPKLSKQPICEESLLTGPLEITNEYYALAKISGIKLCQALREQYNFNSICLMPTNLYGPGDNYNPLNSHVLPALIRKFSEARKNNLLSVSCWGTGTPLREFLYVDDLADACIFVLENWDPNSNNAPKDLNKNPLSWINVGSKYEISIKDLAFKISAEVGYKGDIIWDSSKPDGTPRKKLNCNRLTKLGWEAKTNLNEGIKLTLESYKKELANNRCRT